MTQRVGALDDHFAGRDRPLGEARVLWEIGADGSEVRALRARLGLDSGHLSRLLRSLEAAGLITVTPGEHDQRVRVARATPAGLAELRELDRRSDALAASLLEPLRPPSASGSPPPCATSSGCSPQRWSRSPTPTPSTPTRASASAPTSPSWSAAAARRSTRSSAAPPSRDELRPPNGELVVAYLRAEPVGCGALKRTGPETIDIKRMWLAESARGLGLGRRLLHELEERAARAGARTVRLETSDLLHEAIALYRSAGYEEVPAFNDEPFAHHWFAKDLGVAPRGRAAR